MKKIKNLNFINSMKNITILKNIFKVSLGISLISPVFKNEPVQAFVTACADTDTVTNMSGMFSGVRTEFGNLTSWNVANVRNMAGMFGSCNLFYQDLSQWCVSNYNTNMNNMFQNTPMQTKYEWHPQLGQCPRGEDRP